VPIESQEWELPKRVQPRPDAYAFDLDRALGAVVSLSATVPDDAFTAKTLGTERIGNGVLIRRDGVVLTIGYLITEAEQVTLRTAGGQVVAGHVLGYDQATGFGLLQALQPLDAAPLELGTSQSLALGDRVVVAAGGRRGRAMESRLQARQEFAGYWEYLLDQALFTSPAHPLWSGAAVLSEQGKLIGIGSLQLEQRAAGGRVTPLNMSVPVELLAPVMDELLTGRAPTGPRPWLGVLAQESDGDVMIMGVSERGPASKAELRQGDVVLAVDGEAVSDLASFWRRLWALGPPGVDVPLTLRRGSDVFDVEVRSGDRRAMMRKPRYH